MKATRQQAIQLLYALMYGERLTARYRLKQPVPPRLVSSIRRLLDEDLANSRRHAGPPHLSQFAFYDEPPGGTGHQVEYSPHRVFNLAVAHELARFGCKQGEVVELVADIQSDLKSAFDRANAGLEPFGNMNSVERDATDAGASERDSRAQAKSYLALRQVEATESSVAYFGGAVQAGARLSQKEILDGPDELTRFLAEQLKDGLFALFVMELSELAVGIIELMPFAPLRKRGRPASVPPSNRSDVVDQFRVRERGHGG